MQPIRHPGLEIGPERTGSDDDPVANVQADLLRAGVPIGRDVIEAAMRADTATFDAQAARRLLAEAGDEANTVHELTELERPLQTMVNNLEQQRVDAAARMAMRGFHVTQAIKNRTIAKKQDTKRARDKQARKSRQAQRRKGH